MTVIIENWTITTYNYVTLMILVTLVNWTVTAYTKELQLVAVNCDN